MNLLDELLPLERAGVEAWRRLTAAADDVSHPMRLVTLATCDITGGPDARLMILRGADPDDARLWLHSNLGSPKLDQIRARPAVCLVAWDPRDGVMLRVYADATVHTGGPLHAQHVEHLSRGLSRLADDSIDRREAGAQRDPRAEALLAAGATNPLDVTLCTAVIDLNVRRIGWTQTRRTGVRSAILLSEHGWRSD